MKQKTQTSKRRYNEDKLFEILCDPRSAIGLSLIFGCLILFLVGIFTYPSICHKASVSNLTSEHQSYQDGVCSPQRFVDGLPHWGHNVVTFGTGNIGLILFILSLFLGYGYFRLIKYLGNSK